MMNLNTKKTLLKIETLQKEYDIVRMQYQQAMNDHLNTLNSNTNPCINYKLNSKNISQVCYDKIWHEQGCINNAPQVISDKSLDDLLKYSNEMSMSNKNEDVSLCYGNNIPSKAIILNGNFDVPILENNTYKYIVGDSTVPNWNFINGAVLINNSTDWGYIIPYPSGNQCVSLPNQAQISQKINLKSKTNYTIYLHCSGRNCCDGVNAIKIELNDKNNKKIMEIYEIVPTMDVWIEYSKDFLVESDDEYILVIKGTNEFGDKSSAVNNIYLKYNTSIIYPNISEYISLLGYEWKESNNINTITAETENECIGMCESDMNCSGAIFNPKNKVCTIKKGDPKLIKNNKNIKNAMDENANDENYLLIKKLKYESLILKSLNKKLIDLNKEISNEILLIKPDIDSLQLQEKQNSQTLKAQFKNLSEQEKEIKEQLEYYSKAEDEYNNSSLYANQQHLFYNIFSILSLIVLFITIKYILKSENNIIIIILVAIIWGIYMLLIKIYKK